MNNGGRRDYGFPAPAPSQATVIIEIKSVGNPKYCRTTKNGTATIKNPNVLPAASENLFILLPSVYLNVQL